MTTIKSIPVVLFIASILLVGSVHAQQAVVSAGQEINTATYSMSNSTGLPDFMYYQNDQGIIQFGVQQRAPAIPLSDYSVYLGIMLILSFLFYRYRRQINLTIKPNRS
jgi:hypothetical protein